MLSSTNIECFHKNYYPLQFCVGNFFNWMTFISPLPYYRTLETELSELSDAELWNFFGYDHLECQCCNSVAIAAAA